MVYKLSAAPVRIGAPPSMFSAVPFHPAAAPRMAGRPAPSGGLVVRPRLGQEMTMEEQAAVRAKIDEALATAVDQMSEVESEREAIRSSILREQIADVGPYFSEGKLLTQVVMDADAVAGAVTRLKNSLSGWFEAFENGLADAVFERAHEIVNGVSAAEQEAITDEDERLAHLHTAMHTDPIDALADEAIRMSKGGVMIGPEPSSDVDMKNVALGIGILAGAGILSVILSL